MTTTDNLILDKDQLYQKINRIASEIYERNYLEKRLVIAGIHKTGYIFAQHLVAQLKKISGFEVDLVKLSINKEDPAHSDINIDTKSDVFKKATVIMADDVLNTGRTFIYSLKPILDADVKKVQTAVLVDRGHSMFPVSADYKGYELSTTLTDHVQVVLEKGKEGVFLY